LGFVSLGFLFFGFRVCFFGLLFLIIPFADFVPLHFITKIFVVQASIVGCLFETSFVFFEKFRFLQGCSCTNWLYINPFKIVILRTKVRDTFLRLAGTKLILKSKITLQTKESIKINSHEPIASLKKLDI